MRATLRYNLFRGFTTSASGYDVYQFRINTLYDPDLTGAGHQQLYRDQLYGIYKYATVVGCKWSLTTSTISTDLHMSVVLPTTYATVDTDVSTVIERGAVGSKFTQLGAPVTHRGGIMMHELFGRANEKSILDDDLFRHDSGTDPANIGYLAVYTQNLSAAATGCQTNIVLDFDVMFYELIKVSAS